MRPLARLLYRVEIVGRVPPGAVVVAANHESVLDPPLLALTAEQPLHFLAKVELWRWFGSPVPTQTMSVFDGASATSPIDETLCRSNSGSHVVPALIVFQSPPDAAPT